MSDRAFPALFPAIVSTWRAAKVRELRRHAAKVRAAYTAPGITAHTFAYADALERAADVLADEALTVGQALADARVQDGTHVVVTDCPIWGWTQVCVDGGHVAWRLCDSGPYGDEFVAWDREWETDEFPIRLLSLPCRIVEDADAPPEGRGSM